MTRTVRLPESAHDRASQLAKIKGRSMTAVVADAIERAYQEAFWESAARQVADTRRSDPESWASYRAESAEWAPGDQDPGDDWAVPESARPGE